MSAQFTREKLHSLVWQTPMIRLAAELQISDVGLRKICHRHDIPTPPAGWWAKKEHGKAPDPEPLSGSRPFDEIITVHSSGGLPHHLQAARDRVKATMAAPESTIDPGPIFHRTTTRLAKVKPGRDGLKRVEGCGLITMTVLPSSEARALELLRLLICTAQSTGIGLIAADEDGAVFSFEGESVSFKLAEAADQIDHVPTEKELAAVAKWEREREETYKRYGYRSDYGRPWIPKRDDQYNGRLAIRLESVRAQTEESYWGKPILGTFADTRKRDVMKSIPRIVETIAAIAAAKRSNRKIEELRRAAAASEALRRQEQERLQRLEARRIEEFSKLADEREVADRLASSLDQIKKGVGHEPPMRVRRMLDWAQNRLAKAELALSPAVLEQRLAAMDLFEGPSRPDVVDREGEGALAK